MAYTKAIQVNYCFFIKNHNINTSTFKIQLRNHEANILYPTLNSRSFALSSSYYNIKIHCNNAMSPPSDVYAHQFSLYSLDGRNYK